MKILIVSHDSGGAEIVSAWVKKNHQNDYTFILDGPALSIFETKLKNKIINNNIKELERLIPDHDFLLTGTSWGSDIEKRAIFYSRQNNIRSVAYLDHWTNYLERFEYEGREILPDKIWVGDKEALSIAKQNFKNTEISLVPNFYFKEIQKKILNSDITMANNNKISILFIGEAVSEHAMKKYNNKEYFGYTEFDGLDKYLKYCLEKIGKNIISKIIIRPHPSDKKDKYKLLINKYNDLPISFSEKLTLLEDCFSADLIVGFESMGLIVGLMAGKKVFSIIPKGGRTCSLPHKDIVHLFNNFTDY